MLGPLLPEQGNTAADGQQELLQNTIDPTVKRYDFI